MNFTSACLVVEELSRVDPSVSIMVDIHNTLTNNAVRFWGSEELKKKWLPRLAVDCVSSFALSEAGKIHPSIQRFESRGFGPNVGS